MKLSKIYSNRNFHDTEFNLDIPGLNVVLVLQESDPNLKSTQHGVGKTKFGELIDFMLLKKHGSSFLFEQRNREYFEGYSFYLEILLNDGRYTTIRRSLSAPTKIDFITREYRSNSFDLISDFDTTLPFQKSKEYLNKLLDFDFSKDHDENYRRLINYSIRTQGDYNPRMNTLFQLSKFLRNKDRDWKPLLFNLLGFDGELLKNKYLVEEKIDILQKEIKSREDDIGYRLNDKDSLIGQIQNLENERDHLREALESFDFYRKDRKVIKELVGEVETSIAELNTAVYNIEYDIQKLEESVNRGFAFDSDKVAKIFDETKLHFPDSLKKSYEELVEFNKRITNERNKQVEARLEEKRMDLAKLSKRLRQLNVKRIDYRQIIKDTSLFKKYSSQQSEILVVEKELSRKEALLELLDNLSIKKQEVEFLRKNKLVPIREELQLILDSTITNKFYMNIRKIFSEFVRNILDENALITIRQNQNYNVEFGAEFPNSAKDEGNTYYRILCAAFDLSILISYGNQSYYRFIYHDDIISGDDDGVQKRFVETVIRICSENDIQYIFSTISDNLSDELLKILKPFVITNLSNKSAEGKLFKTDF